MSEYFPLIKTDDYLYNFNKWTWKQHRFRHSTALARFAVLPLDLSRDTLFFHLICVKTWIRSPSPLSGRICCKPFLCWNFPCGISTRNARQRRMFSNASLSARRHGPLLVWCKNKATVYIYLFSECTDQVQRIKGRLCYAKTRRLLNCCTLSHVTGMNSHTGLVLDCFRSLLLCCFENDCMLQ